MKKILIIVAVLVVATLCYFLYTNKNAPLPQVVGTATSTVPTLTFQTKALTQESVEEKFIINVEYPQIKGVSAKVGGAINKVLEETAYRQVDEFKDTNTDFLKDLPEALKNTDEKSYLEVKYTISQEVLPHNILSIRYTSAFYTISAAHPGETTTTLSFDLSTGKKLGLGDIFKGNYVKTISDLVVSDLSTKLGVNSTDEQIQAGAGPESKNFERFYITSRGVVFIFDQYEVAAYAAGAQEVTLSYDRLKDIIDEGGVLGQFAK